MSHSCPTVRVKTDNEQGFKVINEEDFNADEHELFVEGEPPQDETKSEAKKPAAKKATK